MRILIMVNEKRLAVSLVNLIKSSGYDTDVFSDAGKGLNLAESGIYDAIVLDDPPAGVDVCKFISKLRTDHIMTPILMLSGRSDPESRIRVLDSGADYYLTKPFENRELLACLRAVIRRSRDISADTMNFGDLILIPSLSQLSCGEQKISLSARELSLMQLLIQNSSQYLTKRTLLLKIWGYDAEVGSNCVEAYISFLRKKISLLNSSVVITVVRNVGYKLEIRL